MAASKMIGTTLVEGVASGALVILDEPLSFWGGSDPETGAVIESRHPQFGTQLSKRVLVMPRGRGSSSSASVFAEQIRRGVAPVAVLMREPDAILAAGSLVAAALYETSTPIVVLGAEEYDSLPTTGWALVHAASEQAVIGIESP
jgi:predicted aconitase with swiveling domain